MLRLPALLLLTSLFVASPALAAKALFDDTHAEDAGNADWVIDDNFPVPSPAQSGITSTTAGTYWNGGISSFGVDLVKRGYLVHNIATASGNRISYGDGTNPYDLSNYDVFIVPEPNTLFSSAEKTAILDFVHDGGGLIAISDHYLSDRNNDGYDSPMIWNDLDPTHALFGVHFGVSGDANNNIVQTSTNVAPSASDSITRGPIGNVAGLAFHNGTTMTIYPASNPTVRGEVWMTGVAQTSTSGIMAASCQYGSGRVFFIGDSSPVDDGSARSGNSSIYDGWGEAGATDSTLFLNATLWASRRAAPAGDPTPPSVTLVSPVGGEDWKAGSVQSITWSAGDNVGVTAVDLVYSIDGGDTWPYAIATGLANTGSYPWTVPVTPSAQARVRAVAHDAAGNTGSDASAGDFTIDEWVITASSGPGGSISPSGAVYAAQGWNTQFTITPGAGFAIADVLVDGGSTGAVAAYTFTAVSADHAISARFADVAAPAVAVLAPNGGESWTEGAAQDITWSASDNAGVASVTIEYSENAGQGPWIAIASGLPNSGSYSWTVPSTPTGTASVRVSAADAAANAASDTSDAVFAIVDPNAGVEDGPAVLALARPAPNPSGARTTLSFSLPAAGHARLEVIDASGRRIAGTSGAFGAGRHAWRWDGTLADGSRARAGLYFVRLVTPAGTRLQRLVRLE